MITFTVYGRPQSKGSKRLVHTKTGKTQMFDTNRKAADWQAAVSAAAGAEYSGELLDGPVCVNVACVFARPKSHYRTGRNAHLRRDDAPERHAQKPDIDKVLRALLDGLTGIVWRDDSQVAEVYAAKCWGDQDSTNVTISTGAHA
jgi:Holliday junction resolvase RusA-like endonuclease